MSQDGLPGCAGGSNSGTQLGQVQGAELVPKQRQGANPGLAGAAQEPRQAAHGESLALAPSRQRFPWFRVRGDEVFQSGGWVALGHKDGCSTSGAESLRMALDKRRTVADSGVRQEGQPGLNLQEATGLADENPEQEPAMTNDRSRAPMAQEVVARTRARIERLVSIIPITGCWMWMGSIARDGYGISRHSYQDKATGAHRIAYEAWRGTIQEGFELDHLCRHTWCVNPDHLEAVPPEVNWQRAILLRKPVTTCKRGHEFTPSNTMMSREGWRICRQCSRAHCRATRARRAAAKAVTP